MSNPTPEDQAAAVREAIFAGNKIQAIKLYRAQVNIDLAGAKAAVEKLEAELRASSPERFTGAQGKGCFAVVVVALLIGGAGWLLA